MRIITTLSTILFAQKTFQAETPAILQTLLQSLFSLYTILRTSPDSMTEADAVTACIIGVKDGQVGSPTQQALEKEYGVRYSKADDDEKVRAIIVAESVIGCLEVGSETTRRWALHNLIEVRCLMSYIVVKCSSRCRNTGLRRTLPPNCPLYSPP